MKRQGNLTVRAAWIIVTVGIITGAGAERVNADFTFGGAMNLGPVVNSEYHDKLPSISSDGVELYFMSRRPGGAGDWDIWVARRETIHDPWAEPMNIGPTVNSSGEDWAPSISADGLELYFEANRPGGHGDTDILVAVRETIDGPWGSPVNLGSVVNSSSRDGGPNISNDGLELYFKSTRPGGHGQEDLWVSRRPARNEPWGGPVNLGSAVNGPAGDRGPSISADGLVLFFSSTRAGGHGYIDLWLTSRQTKDAAWGEPLNLGPSVNTRYSDDGLSISADGRTLYFSDYWNAVRPGGRGGSDIYEVSISPILDFNGDGSIDGAEVLALTDRWDTDDFLCDIGPRPWGDGIVDVEDLKVVAEHIGQDVDDPTLVAHWALDEMEGLIAWDSAGTCDGAVIGTPVWHPDAGMIDGALELDGSTFVVADHVLSPPDGPFSVLAWVQGGAPGEVILSQVDGENWLCTDLTNGCLMTELKGIGRFSGLLCSDIPVTDGSWHRIALVCDGDDRSLYVDDVLVTEDTQAGGPAGCSGALNIGCGRDMAPGTFFTGLIDDVRIYNRVVRP